MSAAEMAAQPRRPWVLLGSIPLVPSTEDNFLPGTDVFVGFADPPRIAPDHGIPDNYPCVVAVDSSGCFLLHATQGPADEPAVVDRHGRIQPVHSGFAPGYFCDAHTGRASRLPHPADNPVLHLGNVGLIADPRAGAGHYLVAELQPMAGTHHATLMLCYSTGTGRWDEKEALGYARDNLPWGRDGVITHEGRLWWVDLSYGLLTCDPFADQPDLRYVPLPRSCMMAVGRAGLDGHRCVRISAGRLRYVQVHGLLSATQMVTMWTLSDDAAWTREYQVPWSEIWTDKSYAATGMPRTPPTLAAVHPRDPGVVYFFLSAWIFAVDMRARRVVECDACQMADLPAEHLSSCFLHAWELPANRFNNILNSSLYALDRINLLFIPVMRC